MQIEHARHHFTTIADSTATSGFLKITKFIKCKSRLSKMLYNREDAYATEGNFSFILTDNWDGNENEIKGDFRVVF